MTEHTSDVVWLFMSSEIECGACAHRWDPSDSFRTAAQRNYPEPIDIVCPHCEVVNEFPAQQVAGLRINGVVLNPDDPSRPIEVGSRVTFRGSFSIDDDGIPH